MDDNIGCRLKELRIKAGISQRKLAEITHINHATISEFESGKKTPSVQQVKLLCEALEVSPNRMMGYKTDRNRLMEEIEEVLERYI